MAQFEDVNGKTQFENMNGKENSITRLTLLPSTISRQLQLPFHPRPDFITDGTTHYSDTGHVVLIPAALNSRQLNLHVFLTGYNAPALRNGCENFLAVTAENGAPTIALSYEWSNLTDATRNKLIEEDARLSLQQKHKALEQHHHDVCFGTTPPTTLKQHELTNAATLMHQVDISESICQRLARLLLYLSLDRPEEGWTNYLVPVSIAEFSEEDLPSDVVVSVSGAIRVDWSKITLSGHSQGSGHAAYIGKHRILDRLVLLSGPQEGLAGDGFAPLTNHWLSCRDGEAYASQNIYALKHEYEEGTTELIRENWRLIPHLNGENIAKITSSKFDVQRMEIGTANDEAHRRLFEECLPYAGWVEGVVPLGRPYHGSTVMDKFTPRVTVGSGEEKDVCALKEVVWPHILGVLEQEK